MKRVIELVINFVAYIEAKENDNRYYASLSAEELLKECFDLKDFNNFDGKVNYLLGIEKVGKIVNGWIGKN